MYAPVAQSVEQIPFKDKVVGSIPTGRTKLRKSPCGGFFNFVRDGALFFQKKKWRVRVVKILF